MVRYRQLLVQQLFPPEIIKKPQFSPYPGHTPLELADLSHTGTTSVDNTLSRPLLVRKRVETTKREREDGNNRSID